MALYAPTLLNVSQRPTYDAFDVTPSDSVDLVAPPGMQCVGLAVTGAGNVNVNLRNGGTAVLTTIGALQMLDIAVTRILATSTTATGIRALFVPVPR